MSFIIAASLITISRYRKRACLLTCLLGFVASCLAQSPVSFRYLFYDSGELFRVLDSTGTLVEYTVDPAGNITQTTRSTIQASALSILNVTPLSTTLGGTLT